MLLISETQFVQFPLNQYKKLYNNLISQDNFNSWFVFGYILTLSLLYAVLSPYHELWLDEVQCWLIASDASLKELFTSILRHEGHPPLWFFILWPLAKTGVSYYVIKVIGGVIYLFSSYIILTKSHFPKIVRIMLPLSYFIFYQYGIIVRPYGLLFPLMLFIAHAHLTKPFKMERYYILLILLSLLETHGILISLSFLMSRIIKDKLSNKEWKYVFIYGAMLILLASMLWRTQDVYYKPSYPKAIPQAFLTHSYEAIGFTKGIAAVIVFFLFVLCYKAELLLECITMIFSLLLFDNYVYYKEWHYGIYFLILLILLDMIYQKGTILKKTYKHAIAMIIVLVMGQHILWSYFSAIKDIQELYWSSYSVAKFLKTLPLDSLHIYTASYEAMSVLIHFDKSIFRNYYYGLKRRYWSWSIYNYYEVNGIYIVENQENADCILMLNVDRKLYAKYLKKFKYEYTFPASILWKGEVLYDVTFVLFLNEKLSSLIMAKNITYYKIR